MFFSFSLCDRYQKSPCFFIFLGFYFFKIVKEDWEE
tara:strand:- start:257 stop:364 length:108 start_codon:yes stop_codon:yes gene_type:complete